MQRLQDLSLEGQRALVTGGTRGLGREVGETLARAGADVVLLARTEAALASEAKRMSATGARVTFRVADLSDTEAVAALSEELADEGWDILVNCAGVVHSEDFLAIERRDWDTSLAVNLTAPFLLSQGVGRSMVARGYGRITNVSSHSGRRTQAGAASYSAAKAALQMLTQSLAVELGPYGVRSNAISPTVFMSDMGQELWNDPEVKRTKIEAIPAKRFAEVAEIADLILYLSSPAADFVNGSIIGIDGGLYAGRPQQRA